MNILRLNTDHSEQIDNLFTNQKYMGLEINASTWGVEGDTYSKVLADVFKNTYLSGLKNFQAYGLFNDQEELQCLISFYQSTDEPAWYYTLLRSNGSTDSVKNLLDAVIKINEDSGRYKFYTLVNSKHARLLRRFTYSDYNNERYGYFDEYKVPAKTRCYYTYAWDLLYKRVLLPMDTTVRCSFLKQEYRPEEIIGGSL